MNERFKANLNERISLEDDSNEVYKIGTTSWT
jgi:hypothetical protein